MLRHQTMVGPFTRRSTKSSARANLKIRRRRPPQASLACPSHTAGPRPPQSPQGAAFGSSDLWENEGKLDKFFVFFHGMVSSWKMGTLFFLLSLMYLYLTYKHTLFHLCVPVSWTDNLGHILFGIIHRLCYIGKKKKSRRLINIQNSSRTSGLTDIKKAFIPLALYQRR